MIAENIRLKAELDQKKGKFEIVSKEHSVLKQQIFEKLEMCVKYDKERKIAEEKVLQCNLALKGADETRNDLKASLLQSQLTIREEKEKNQKLEQIQERLSSLHGQLKQSRGKIESTLSCLSCLGFLS